MTVNRSLAGRPVGGVIGAVALASTIGSDIGQKHVPSGLTVEVDSGLDIIVNPGVVSVGTQRVDLREELAITLSAEVDAYIGIDVVTGTIAVSEVPNGDPAPTEGQTEARLAKVVTDPTDVTSIVDLRKVAPVSAKHVTAESYIGRRLLNGDFGSRADSSAPPDKWLVVTGTFGTDVTVSSDALSGDKCLAFQPTGVTSEVEHVDLILLTQVDVPWRFMFDRSVDPGGGGSDTGSYTVELYDEAHAYLADALSAAFGGTASWRTTEAYFVPSDVDAAARFAKVRFARDNGTSDLIMVDNVSLEPVLAYCDAQVTSAQAIATGTPTKVEHNYGSVWGGEFDNVNYKFVCARDATYDIEASIGITGIGDGKRVALMLYRGGVLWRTLASANNGAAGDVQLHGRARTFVSGGDELEIWVEHNHGLSRNLIQADTFFTIKEVGFSR